MGVLSEKKTCCQFNSDSNDRYFSFQAPPGVEIKYFQFFPENDVTGKRGRFPENAAPGCASEFKLQSFDSELQTSLDCCQSFFF